MSRMVRIGGRKWPKGLRPPKAVRNRKKNTSLHFSQKKSAGAEILVVVKVIYGKALYMVSSVGCQDVRSIAPLKDASSFYLQPESFSSAISSAHKVHVTFLFCSFFPHYFITVSPINLSFICQKCYQVPLFSQIKKLV